MGVLATTQTIASTRFERLADTASARGGPRAPLFYLKAGQSRILAGQTALGMPSLKRGLELLAQREQFPRLQTAGVRAVSDLKERGLIKEASEIESWMKAVLPSQASYDASAKKPVLPTHCASCGAGVRADEVEWLDDVTAECAYCGSALR